MADRNWITVFFPTPLIFRYHLPLNVVADITKEKKLADKNKTRPKPTINLKSFLSSFNSPIQIGLICVIISTSHAWAPLSTGHLIWRRSIVHV